VTSAGCWVTVSSTSSLSGDAIPNLTHSREIGHPLGRPPVTIARILTGPAKSCYFTHDLGHIPVLLLVHLAFHALVVHTF
jgi:hypothetical protein